MNLIDEYYRMLVDVDGSPQWRDTVVDPTEGLMPEIFEGEVLERVVEGTWYIFTVARK